MAYYVAVKVNEKYYEAVNIKRCKMAFTTNYRYEEPCACTLQEINNITTTYNSEEEFKIALRKDSILKPEHLDKPLVIFYFDKVEKRLVEGKLLYEDSIDLIENISEVTNYILTKFKDNDYKFFKQLAETLREDSINKYIKISQIASSIEARLVNQTEENQSLDNEIITVTKLLIYKNDDIDEKGIVSTTNKLDYEAFHNLVSFIIDYEEILKKDKTSGYAKTMKKSE